MSLLDKASLISTPNGFKASKLYSIVPSSGAGDLDVVRATTATRVNSAGLIESVATNVPRIDYTNGSCPSLLVEPQRTNLLTYSEQFDNADWVKTNTSVTANSTLSPDGTQNADTLTKSSTGVDGTIVRIVSATATGYVGSIFIKKDTNTSRFPEFFLRSSDALGDNEIYVQLNTSTGATSIRLQTGTASVSTPVLINGYWRISLYTLASLNTCRFGIRPAAGTTLGVFNANATGSIIAYGAQLEVGTYPTSYIPTIASSVTRNADVISKTGISSLIGQTEGTVFIDLNFKNISQSSGVDTLFTLNNGTTANEISILLDTPSGANKTILGYIRTASSNEVILYAPTTITATRYKIALSYKLNDVVLYINGTQIGTDTSAAIPTTSAISLNSRSDSSFLNTQQEYINSAQLYKTRLSNSELASLTTL